MLEEGLRSPTFSPAEAAQGLLSFVRFELTDGGAIEEKRFIGLFSLFCERLYGPMSTVSKENFRHQTGGWLARQSRWEIPRPPTGQQKHHHHHAASTAAPSLDADPVVQLLCGMESLKSKEKLPTFLEAISGNTEARRGVRIQYPFQALPKPTQDFYLKMIQSAIDGSPVDDSIRSNAFRLLGGLLRVPPRDQTELRRILAAKSKKAERSRPLSLSPGGAAPMLLSSTKPINVTLEMPQIMLNLVEYFLISFIRYPLASPAPLAPAPQGGNSGITRHRVSPYGELVYSYLFRCYLLHYLPVHQQDKHFLGFPNLSVENELFLRIIIEFWLAGNMELMPIQKAAESVLERRKKNGNLSVTLDLESAFDLVNVRYEPPPPQIQKCLLSLVVHVLKDPNVAPAVMDCSNVASKKGADDASMALPWCLSPSMTVLQQAFYNHVIVAFRYAPIHVAGSPFYAALDTWLLWLEPWNVEIRRKHGPTDFAHAGSVLANTVSHMAHPSTAQKQETIHVLKAAKPTARSKYTNKWEPFVAANLHLYTVPLALFLRRARELDFSSLYFSRSFALLQRVFRVYSPELMNSINEILAQGSQHCMASLVESHGKNLGAYSSSLVGKTHMTSLQNDMRNLLEEVYMQYRKTVRERGFFDRVEANIEGVFSYFGLVEASTGEERKIQQLFEKAKLVAGLPADYQIMPSDSGGAPNSMSRSAPRGQAVKANGVLTEHGKWQVISGEVTCSSSDFAHGGDSMYGSVKSHELSWLVPLTIRASDYLNSRLGLAGATKVSVRFNLRFLADYRNLLFLILTLWVWMRFLL